MGLFRKHPVDNPPAVQEHSAGSMTQRMSDGANAALDKASQVYHKNPKLIGGLAAVAGAILLTRMKRGRPTA
jgi:hypothetical protein